MQLVNKKNILNTYVNVGSKESFIEEIITLSENNSSSYVCLCNVHMLIEANDSKEFSCVVNGADLVLPDGQPVATGLSLLYDIQQSRVPGMDLIKILFGEIEERKSSVFLYGSTQDVLNKIRQKAETEFINLNIVGTLSPPFRALTEDEESLMIYEINKDNPDFVLVALGCPKQEIWMSKHKGKINACMIGLGGAFPVYAGEVSRAPEIMQKYGLEWLYRLIKEPKRLWKRYLYTNTKFIYLFSRQYFLTKIKSIF